MNNKNSIYVSVIVPVYNVEQYLKRCVNSILEQTEENIEIILVDDGSPDSCPQLCDEFAAQDNRIKVIHQKNAGLGMARNSGLEIASGEFVMFVDSDDYIVPNAIEILYHIAETSNADTVLAGYYRKNTTKINECLLPFKDKCFEGKAEIINNILINMLGSPPDYYDDIFLKRSVWGNLYSLKLLKKNNILFCSERKFISEDLIFDMEYYPITNKVAVSSKPVYYYCVNSESLTLSYDKDRFIKQIVLFHELKKRAKNLDLNIDERLNRSFIGNARQCIYSEAKHRRPLQAMRGISSICKNEELKNVLNNYHSSAMPFRQKVFLILMKMDCSFGIYLICRVFK